jgi:Mg-chelatase subunit ChlD
VKPKLDTIDTTTLARWRLVLGDTAEAYGISCSDRCEQEAGEIVDFLFEKEPESDTGKSGRRRRGSRTGGRGSGHSFTVPAWVDAVQRLFPRQAKEVMERELVRRRGLTELLEKPELLEKVEANVELVKTLLTHRDLLNPKTRVLARKIIEKVVQELKDKLKVQVEPAIVGALRRDRHSPRKVFRNLDLKTTLRRNLHNWDQERQKLLVDHTFFFAAERNRRPWHVIIAVDQSGSMLDSAVFSAVMASIFYELPAMRTSLYLFDTEVADLTDLVGAPVDVLLKVQLGGGTDIAKAVRYGRQLVREPARTILVLISDFYEGGQQADLIREVQEMSEAGVRMIGLGALGYDARPDYNKSLARRLRKVGMDILVCTPERLADCIGQIIRG